MKQCNLKSVVKLTAFQVNVHKKLIFGWSLAIFGLMFLYMILFPTMQDMAQMKMDAMPKELLQLMGMENFSDMGDFVPYFGMIFGLIVVAISVFAVTFGTNLIVKEEKSGRIESLCAFSLSRTEIYLSQVFTGFIGVLAIVFSAAVATLICGFANGGETFVVFDVLLIMKVAGSIPFFFLAVGLCLGGISARRTSASVGSAVVFGSYMLGYLGKLLGDKGEFLRDCSPFEVFQATNILALETETVIAWGVFVVLMISLCIIGGFAYRKRDLAV